MLKDQQQRIQATDPCQSFIVQAPAGSGKTELLTQRFLRLLDRVTAPEQIVALTFTRKAASEMHERIMLALKAAQNNTAVDSAHQQRTQEFAKKALQRDQQFNWQLLKHPARLRVMTIDSLCQSLTHAIPFQEKQVPFAQVSEDADGLYLQAARACLTYALNAEFFQPSIRLLLEHLDNRQDKLLSLFCNLLSTREQWLTQLYAASTQTRAVFEQALQDIEEHEFQRFLDSIPLQLQEPLRVICVRLANIENNQDSPRYPLQNWKYFSELNKELVVSLASLLLTKNHEFRKSFDHHVGLKKDSCPKAIYAQLKEDSRELLQHLSELSEFLPRLIRVKNLPPPCYNESQWQILQALLTLLPLLPAHLQLIFNENNAVDFTAVAQQALLALGKEDEPTDLALYLDHSIHHLLVDEFQDTSIQQFQLLTRLIQGWQPDEGKTLFLVGDPMQSIYRFRQAEVGLFLKARDQGLASIRLTALELCCNFRSTAVLVDWVNHHFLDIFPERDDMESGAISFHASVNVKTSDDKSNVSAHQYRNKRQEAEAIAEAVIQELAADVKADIAILVRSRSQLSELIPVLREKNIAFQGVEIEKLSHLPHLQDIWSLTKALLMPANRLAWLSLLRSPWCGLALADLHGIASLNRKKSIFAVLADEQLLSRLSPDGRRRAQFVYQVMKQALERRHRQGLTEWIIAVSKNLHADRILNDEQLLDLEPFWQLLESHTENNQLSNPLRFESCLQALYSQQVQPARLQIMTIHKSKGLEFDTVILPGMGSKSRQSDKPLLRWLKLPGRLQDELLLVSPIRAAHENWCPLYDYLGELSAEKEYYEQQRLLYVAVTRARKKLYLFDHREKTSEGTFRAMLRQQIFNSDSEEVESASEPSLPVLYRLPLTHYALLPAALSEAGNYTLPPLTPQFAARHAGVIAHELLQWIGDNHITELDKLPWNMIKTRFRQQGFSAQEQDESLEKLRQHVAAMLADPIGQWLFRAHTDEQNEYQLLVLEKEEMQIRIIDRTFREKGSRWIIDYKSGSEDESARQKHIQQVNAYAHHFSTLEQEPICCGLYYLSTGAWLSWKFSVTLEQSIDFMATY